MCMTKKIAYRRDAFTLVEMLVVIAIILAIAALAAAFAPRVNDNQKLTRAVDNLEQWLLTAKMRAKRDGLATGIRFVQAPGDAAIVPGPAYSQFQYIQQPEPLIGGVCVGGPPFPATPPPGTYQYPLPAQLPPLGGNYYTGGLLSSAATVLGMVQVTFQGVDFTLGGQPPNQYLVQPGDYLEINGGGVYMIGQVSTISPTNTLVLGIPNITSPYVNPPTPTAYDLLLSITQATTNYRILRQPRLLLGEEPVNLPNNYVAVVNNLSPVPTTFANAFSVPDVSPIPNPTCNVLPGTSGSPEVLFSPTGAVVGTNAGNSLIWISVWDYTMEYPDANRVGVVGIQSRSGFLGAYGISVSGDPLFFVRTARESGL